MVCPQIANSPEEQVMLLDVVIDPRSKYCLLPGGFCVEDTRHSAPYPLVWFTPEITQHWNSYNNYTKVVDGKLWLCRTPKMSLS